MYRYHHQSVKTPKVPTAEEGQDDKSSSSDEGKAKAELERLYRGPSFVCFALTPCHSSMHGKYQCNAHVRLQKVTVFEKSPKTVGKYKPTLCCTSQWGKKIQKYKKRYTKTQVQKNIQKKYKNLNWVGEASEAEVCNEGAGSRRNYKHWVTAARTDGPVERRETRMMTMTIMMTRMMTMTMTRMMTMTIMMATRRRRRRRNKDDDSR